MAFVKTEKYFLNKIRNIQRAIAANQESLEQHKALNNKKAVEAHEAYINSCKKELKKARSEFEAWRKLK
jgi:hypothetical protein